MSSHRPRPTAISLFSGAGGDSLGLEMAGYDVVAFSETNKDAIKTHRQRFPSCRLITSVSGETDITKIPDDVFEEYRDRIDMVFAGFPCQGFSNAGKKRADDERNELVYEFVRVCRIIKPKIILGENVVGLLSRNGVDPLSGRMCPVMDIIERLFNDIGYTLTWSIHEAQVYGVPQRRKRLIIVGNAGTTPLECHQPSSGETTMSASSSLRDILQPTLRDAVVLEDMELIKSCPPSTWIRTHEDTPNGTPHKNLLRLLDGEQIRKTVPSNHPSNDGCFLSVGKRKSPYHGEIINPDALCKTIICTYNSCPRLFVGLHNPTTRTYFVRTLQTQELAQIQGFPKDYPFVGSLKSIIIQIGNAVPPPMIKWIASNLRQHDT